MKRLPDWPERLIAFFEARRVRAFSWGSNDCWTFVVDAVCAMTGVDTGQRWRTYKTERGALASIKKVGGLRKWVETNIGMEKPKGFAQRGDVVLAVLDGRETLGIVMGDGKWCGPGVDGLVARHISDEVTAVFQV